MSVVLCLPGTSPVSGRCLLMEQLAHRSPLMDAQDHVGQQRRDGNDGELVAGQRCAFLRARSPPYRSRRPRQHAFADDDRTRDRRGRRGWRRRPHPARPARGRSWPRDERAGGVDLIVHDDHVVACHIADQVEHLGLARRPASAASRRPPAAHRARSAKLRARRSDPMSGATTTAFETGCAWK